MLEFNCHVCDLHVGPYCNPPNWRRHSSMEFNGHVCDMHVGSSLSFLDLVLLGTNSMVIFVTCMLDSLCHSRTLFSGALLTWFTLTRVVEPVWNLACELHVVDSCFY